MGLVWEDKYSVGVKEIDLQHQQLIQLIDKAISLIGQSDKQSAFEMIFADLEGYTQKHFATEETYFDKFNFGGAGEHKAAHRGFEKDLIDLKKQYQTDQVAGAFALTDYLENWLVNHLMAMDKKYVECFHQHGLR